MIYIVRIGWQDFALRNNRGLATVVDVMSRAVEVAEDNRYCGDGIKLKPGSVRCSFEAVPDFSFGPAKREVIDPEVIPRRRAGESDAMFAMRAARAQRVLSAGSPMAVAGAVRRLLGEGGGK